jgi:hypothetical protein
MTNHARQTVGQAVKRMIDSGASVSKVDGKVKLNTHIVIDMPWRFIQHHPENHTVLWKVFIYEQVVKALPPHLRFIPSGCLECYKVVVKPDSYEELLELEMVMSDWNYPGKCGIERRPYVKGIYGGYFYNRGLEKGLARLEQVRNVFPNAFLKRGCTEYEIDFGPSDQWSVLDHQMEYEEAVSEMVVIDKDKNLPSPQMVDQIHERWRRWAWKYDPHFLNSNIPDYVRYER